MKHIQKHVESFHNLFDNNNNGQYNNRILFITTQTQSKRDSFPESLLNLVKRNSIKKIYIYTTFICIKII